MWLPVIGRKSYLLKSSRGENKGQSILPAHFELSRATQGIEAEPTDEGGILRRFPDHLQFTGMSVRQEVREQLAFVVMYPAEIFLGLP